MDSGRRTAVLALGAALSSGMPSLAAAHGAHAPTAPETHLLAHVADPALAAVGLGLIALGMLVVRRLRRDESGPCDSARLIENRATD